MNSVISCGVKSRMERKSLEFIGQFFLDAG
jgi:hypothetical protein